MTEGGWPDSGAPSEVAGPPGAMSAATPSPPAYGGHDEAWGRRLAPSLVIVCALVGGEGVFLWRYHPPGRQPLATIGVLLGSAVLALLVGTWALVAGPRVGLSTIRRKMVFSASLGALFAFGDAVVSARLMFVSLEDVPLLMALLLFALLISLMLTLALAGMIQRALAVLTRATRRMAAGHLDTAAPVESGDEMAGLAGDLERMAANLAAAQRMRQTLEDTRRDLVAGISHDLRTPLNALQAVSSALADGVAAEEPATIARYLGELDAQVDRLAALIDDMFMLVRLEGPAPEVALASYPTADLLSNLLERARPLAREAEVDLEVAVSGSMPAVLVDVRQIERVLDNLVRNALQHTPPGGAITVQAAPHGERDREVIMTVADTGEGIAPADLPLLFELYYRGNRRAAGAGGAGGVGLGLAIVKAVVQAHGGRVWAESPPPGQARGAFISVVLPAADAQPRIGPGAVEQ